MDEETNPGRIRQMIAIMEIVVIVFGSDEKYDDDCGLKFEER